MTLSEAFELGWIVGSVMNFQHPANLERGRGYDFQEALRRFEKRPKAQDIDINIADNLEPEKSSQ